MLEVEVVRGNTDGGEEDDRDDGADEFAFAAEVAVSPVTGELASEGLNAGESEEGDDDVDDDEDDDDAEELGRLLFLLLELLPVVAEARVIAATAAAEETRQDRIAEGDGKEKKREE